MLVQPSDNHSPADAHDARCWGNPPKDIAQRVLLGQSFARHRPADAYTMRAAGTILRQVLPADAHDLR